MAEFILVPVYGVYGVDLPWVLRAIIRPADLRKSLSKLYDAAEAATERSSAPLLSLSIWGGPWDVYNVTSNSELTLLNGDEIDLYDEDWFAVQDPDALAEKMGWETCCIEGRITSYDVDSGRLNFRFSLKYTDYGQWTDYFGPEELDAMEAAEPAL